MKLSTKKNNLTIEHLSLTDNLEEVADLIYATDPYIYPYWFKNFPSWKNVLIDIIKTEGSAFSYSNILVAKIKSKIVGILIYISKDSNLSFNYDSYANINKHFKYTIKKYISHLKDNVKDDVVYIPNICVNEGYRNRKIATSLIVTLKQLFPNKQLILHCLKNNLPAVSLYTKTGFKVIEKLKGFNSPYLLKPTIYEMRYTHLN